MKSLLLTIGLLTFTLLSYSQNIYQIRADSVRIYNDCDTAEFILENHTQMVPGYLYNKGRGRTEFRRMRFIDLGLGLIAIGDQDTLNFGNSSLGDQFIRNQFSTAQIADYWIKGRGRIDNTLTLGLLKNNETEDSVLTTDANGNVKLKLAGGNYLQSLNGLTDPDQTFSIGTSGTDFNISSNSNVHFFNLPSASTTARGLVTTGYQEFAGSKTFTQGLNLLSTPNQGSAATKYLTLNSNVVNYRTPAQMLSDIGGAPANGSSSYIQNQIGAVQASSNFWLSGSGIANTGFQIRNDGAATFEGQFTLMNAAANRGANFQLDASTNPGLNLWVHDGSTWQNRMTWDASGNVGIGTSSPAVPLSVIGEIRSSTQITVPQVFSNASAGTLTLIGGATASLSNRGGEIDLVGGSGGTDPGTVKFYSGTGTGGTQQPERMRIDASGNVAIGQTSVTSGYKFEASGAGRFSGTVTAWSTGIDTRLWSIANTAGVIGTVTNSPFLIYTNNTEKVRIDATGNVGIGTNAPTSTLQVIGSIGKALNTVTSSTTLNTTQHTILVNNSANVTITLPAASTCSGREYVIKKISNNAFTVSIDPNGSENIEGSSTPQVISTYLNSFTIQCDGTSWWIL